jgi:hypothetical protein
MSNQGGDIASVATNIEQQSTEIRRRSKQHQKKRIVSEGCNDRIPFLVFEDRGIEWTVHRRSPKRFCFVDEGGNTRGQVLVIEAWGGESFDQEAVFPKHQNGINSRTLSKRAREISYVRHLWEKVVRS